MNWIPRVAVGVFLLYFLASPGMLRGEDALPAGVTLIAEDVVEKWIHQVSVSPDGSAVAYLQGDRLCLHQLDDSDGLRFEITPVGSHLGLRLASIGGWGPEGKSVLFTVSKEDKKNARSKKESKTFLFSKKGELSELASSKKHPGFGGKCHLTNDRRFLVFAAAPRPLIWDIRTNRPHATPFEKLVPSSTSKHWIGIEKDTKQLVHVNEKWHVIERTPYFFSEFALVETLQWSDDEQFILLKGHLERTDALQPPKNVWLNLKTEHRHEFASINGYQGQESLHFLDTNGEFVRAGVLNAYNGRNSSQIASVNFAEVIKPPIESMERSWRWESRSWSHRPTLPIWSDDATRFAYVDAHHEVIVVDREKRSTQLPRANGTNPQQIVGFALGGKALVVRSRDKLFLFNLQQLIP